MAVEDPHGPSRLPGGCARGGRLLPRVIAGLAASGLLALALSGCGGAAVATVAVLDSNTALSTASNPVAVSPEPGTPDASPASQISFLGGPGTTVLKVRAVGSRSGAHTGVLRSYSMGTGASFIAAQPFRQGERVSVRAKLRVGGHEREARTSFTVAVQPPIAQKEFPDNPGDPHALQHYSTAPALTPSSVAITTAARAGAPAGYLFLAPYQGIGSPGPMIAEQDGSLVWFHPLPSGESSTNFSVQQYEGKPVLSWWQGRILELGFGQGEDVLYNTSYQPVVSIRAGNGYKADLHVLRITPEGTAWIDAYDPVDANLSSVGGPANGVLNDSVVQEIDIRTGLVMWEWHADGHIALADSKNPPQHSSYPWDFVHINSVDPGSSGDVLMSFRNIWGLEDIDLHSGGLRWRLGGPHSNFKLGPGANFYWQHDAEFQPGGLISVFDNGSTPPEEKQSRGLLLDPNFRTHEVRLLKQFVNPSKTLLASSQGDTQSLPGGNWLLGYGGLPNFTEFSPAGKVLLAGSLGHNVQSFKVLLYPWSGQAPGSPAAVVAPGPSGGLSVSVSWNGATEVASWRVIAGASPTTLLPLTTVARGGFQTQIEVPASAPYLAVQALNAAGAVIGASPTTAG
jgi:Arylsulfotransferase (ASST)